MELSHLVLVLAGVVLAGLAGFRVARAITIDTLFEGTRDKVEHWGYVMDVPKDDKRYGTNRTFGKGKTADLLTCPYCLGFWITSLAWLVTAHVLGVDLPWYGHLVAASAASGLQAYLQARSASQA